VWGTGRSRRSIQVLSPDGNYGTLSINPSLEAALHGLRLSNRQRPLWVDAICIDMDNYEERNLIVPRMADVFAKAQAVCVWIGDANDDTKLAFELIFHHLLNVLDFDKALSSPTLLQNWIAFSKLLRRPWFSRRWVIQEISCASSAELYCGDDHISWTDFMDAIRMFGVAQQIWRSRPNMDNFRREPYLQDIEELPASYLVDAVDAIFQRTDDGRMTQRQLTLDHLVTTLVPFQITEPRDTIYALIGLAKDVSANEQGARDDNRSNPFEDNLNGIANDDETQTAIAVRPVTGTHDAVLRVDYGKPYIDIWIDFMIFSMNAKQALDIICYPWAPDPARTQSWEPEQVPQVYPSWIVPATLTPFQPSMNAGMSRVNADPLVGHGRPGKRPKWAYNAAGSRQPHWFLEREMSGPILNALGLVVDAIEKTEAVALEGIIPKEWTKATNWTDLAKLPPSTFWKTIVANRGPQSVGAPRYYERVCQTAYEERAPSGALNIPTLLASSNLSSLVIEYLELAQAVVWGRRLIKMKNGTIGLGPGAAERGDLICILFGCSVPVVLRKIEGREGREYFQLVGECYVLGLMSGEALESLSERTLDKRSETFSLV
jgi:hypothetical protein